jgi:hypothetical protein
MATIVFRIKKDGSVDSEVSNTVGVHCEQISKLFADALGEVTSETRKPEFFLDQIQTEAQVFNHED